jgi:hypothetical protein
LQLAGGDRLLGNRPVVIDDRISGILPAHVVVALGREGLVFLETVRIEVAVAVDPF